MYKAFTRSSTSTSTRGAARAARAPAATRRVAGRAGDTPGGFGRPLIGALLRFPREVVVQRMLEALQAQDHDLTPAELNVMMYPGPDGKRPSELARQCAMSRQAMNYLLSGLEARGYLMRADGDEALARVVHLSERGRAAGRLMRKAVEEVEREWRAFLGDKRFEALSETLLDLSRWLGKVP